jgi:beta-lactamase superfamily II metal-dependent hydrolase
VSEIGLPPPSVVDTLLGGIEDIDKASYIIVHCLWCDQGMAHLMEVYEEGGSQDIPAAMILIDFGAEQMFKSRVLKANQAAPAVGFIIEKLLLLKKAGKEERLDFVVISHQDTDHWSLITYLLDAVEAEEIDLKVGKVAYGGGDWGESAKAAVKRLGAYTADSKNDVIPWTKFSTDYNYETGVKAELLHVGDVFVRTLVVNAPATGSISMKKNTTGAMMVIEYKSTTYILPGDATWQTLKSCTDVIDKWVEKQKTQPVKPCFMMSVPHHGSLDTIVPNSTAAKLDFALAKKFVGQTEPDSIIASAGSKNSFSHPYLVVLAEFGANAGDNGFGAHNIVVVEDVKKEWNVLVLIKNIYTTVLTTALPVEVCNWSFALRADGRVATIGGTFEQPTKETVMPGETKTDDVTDLDTGLVARTSPALDAPSPSVPIRRVTAPLPRPALASNLGRAR